MHNDDVPQNVFGEDLEERPGPGPGVVYLLVNAALLKANPEAVARIAEEHLVRLRTGDYVSQNNTDAMWRWEKIALIAADATLKLMTS